jgi:hypothetical protein
MTHHCPRSNWTGPESELRRGICPKCAGTTLYEDCSVRRVDITFTDEQGNEFCLRTFPGHTGKHGEFWRYGEGRDATPDDLARAGYIAVSEAKSVIRDEMASAREPILDRLRALKRELYALRAFEDQARNALENGRWEGPAISEGLLLLKAIDEARK